MQKHLVIFVKAPIMGRVKTRLAQGIGKVAAWRFYKKTVTGLLKRVARGKWKTTLYVSPDEYKGTFFPKNLEITPQGRGDLGERMQRVFDQMPPGPVVLIGGDIPTIEKHHITRAFDALKTNEMVFGPAEDGGYWLVGMRRNGNRIAPFESVRWSTVHTLKDTVENIDPNVRVAFIDTLNDVDTVDDL
jgi:rSAM/selenodomain-associated transferase 1